MSKNVLYLHGFASSPFGTKAGIFRERLATYDVNYQVPDLNVPDFEHLTLTAILGRIAETVDALPAAPTYLIGSSFGGLAALHFADRYPQSIEKLLLLAPALDFMDNRQQHLGADGLAAWKAAGSLPFFNYATQSVRPVHYGLVEDIQQYDSNSVNLDLPIMIFHGRNDESVDHQQSVRYAKGRANVDLHLVESDHSLIDQTERIGQAIIDFFELARLD